MLRVSDLMLTGPDLPLARPEDGVMEVYDNLILKLSSCEKLSRLNCNPPLTLFSSSCILGLSTMSDTAV